MKPRICLPIIGNQGWLGGVSYLENLIKSVRILPESEQPEVFLYLEDHTLGALELHAHFLALFTGIIYKGPQGQALSEYLRRPVVTVAGHDELYELIDFFFKGPDEFLGSYCSAAWIPDFQHVHLPQFFQPEDIQLRDRVFRHLADQARMIVLSSHDAESDFRSIFPYSPVSTRVLSFHTLPEKAWLEGDPEEVQLKYGLPDAFLICCNQFWTHKNHVQLFRALALVAHSGNRIHLVCTGSTTDYRFKEYFSKLTGLLEQLGIADLVHILGIIPRSEQIQLVRRSLAVVQPSLFEGWSTVVEDARALGKTLILSDLAVHREQDPDFTVYFDRNDADSLAAVIRKVLPVLQPGPNRLREQFAQVAAQRKVTEYGRTFCDIARETITTCRPTGKRC